MSYQVIKEILRLYPPAAATFRTSGKGQEIGGYNIPADTPIMVNSFLTVVQFVFCFYLLVFVLYSSC